MYIQRNTFKVRPGCMEDAVAMVQREIEYSHANGWVLTPIFGPFDTAMLEIRFQSLAEYEKFWAGWMALPTTPKFFEEWPSVTIIGGTSELWEIREPLAEPRSEKIVNRRTFLAQNGKYEDLVKLLLLSRQEGSFRYEILTPTFGPNDTIEVSFNFESVAEHDKAWEEWGKTEQAGQFFEKWFQLVEPGGTNEIWEVR